jgi:hypothetical protein
MHRDNQIRICYSHMYCMREGQISINTRGRPERYLLNKHVVGINTNIFAFTCCVQLCYLDSRVMRTVSVVDRRTYSKRINFMVWLQ